MKPGPPWVGVLLEGDLFESIQTTGGTGQANDVL